MLCRNTVASQHLLPPYTAISKNVVGRKKIKKPLSQECMVVWDFYDDCNPCTDKGSVGV